MTFSDLLLAVLTLRLGAAVAGVMSETNSCTDIKDKIMGKRLPISWPRIEKNIGFQMCVSENVSRCPLVCPSTLIVLCLNASKMIGRNRRG